jgi:ABC-type sugar transport system substrate-binding protein
VTVHAHWKGARFLALAVLAVAALALSACGSSSDDSSTGSTGAAASTGASTGASTASGGDKKEAKIAAFIVDSANPYDTALSNSEKATAAKLGASIDVFGAANDPQKQVSQCSDALAKQAYNVFLIKAVAGPTMMPCAKQALAAGIVVVAVDTPLGPDFGTTKPQVPGISGSILSLPNTNGDALAAMTEAACGDTDPCKVAYYHGPPAFTFAAESLKTFLADVKKTGKIDVVDQNASNFDLATGYNLAKTLLAKDPTVNVITSDSDQSALGAAKAVKEAGKESTIKVIGGGGSNAGAAAIKSGVLYGTSALYPGGLGEKSVELGVKALNKEELGETEADIATLVPLGTKITKENVEEFKPEWG